MPITYAPGHPLPPRPRRPGPGPVGDRGRLGAVAALLALLVAAGSVVHLLDTRSAARLDGVMTAAARALLPGGRVGPVAVVDGPALLAERHPQVRETTATGRTGDGLPVRLDVRDYDRAAGVARMVSWQVTGLPLPAGWRVVDGAAGYLSQVEREIDGHRVQLTGTAALEGDRVLVVPGRLTLDGAPAALSDLPPAVRAAVEPALTPWRVAVPVPGVPVSVHYVWFDGTGIGVELRAADVPTGTGGR